MNNNNYSDRVRRILEEGKRCNKNYGCCGSVTGARGATARCNKSSIYIFKW